MLKAFIADLVTDAYVRIILRLFSLYINCAITFFDMVVRGKWSAGHVVLVATMENCKRWIADCKICITINNYMSESATCTATQETFHWVIQILCTISALRRIFHHTIAFPLCRRLKRKIWALDILRCFIQVSSVLILLHAFGF